MQTCKGTKNTNLITNVNAKQQRANRLSHKAYAKINKNPKQT